MSQAKEVFYASPMIFSSYQNREEPLAHFEKNFVCHLLKCKLPVPSLDLSVIGVFIHFNRGYCTVGVR